MIMFQVLAESFLWQVRFSKFRANLLKCYMLDLICNFQNTYFPEQLSVASSGIKKKLHNIWNVDKFYLQQVLEN